MRMMVYVISHSSQYGNCLFDERVQVKSKARYIVSLVRLRANCAKSTLDLRSSNIGSPEWQLCSFVKSILKITCGSSTDTQENRSLIFVNPVHGMVAVSASFKKTFEVNVL